VSEEEVDRPLPVDDGESARVGNRHLRHLDGIAGLRIDGEQKRRGSIDSEPIEPPRSLVLATASTNLCKDRGRCLRAQNLGPWRLLRDHGAGSGKDELEATDLDDIAVA